MTYEMRSPTGHKDLDTALCISSLCVDYDHAKTPTSRSFLKRTIEALVARIEPVLTSSEGAVLRLTLPRGRP